jgi:hypothetical protein
MSQNGNRAEPPPDAWDEADEDVLVARVQATGLQEGGEADVRRRDAVLLRETEAVISRAITIPGERKMLLKLDDQLEKFMGNRDLQHIKINGVSEKQVVLIKAVAVLFRMRTVLSNNSISIHKTEESIVPVSRFGEPRNVAGECIQAGPACGGAAPTKPLLLALRAIPMPTALCATMQTCSPLYASSSFAMLCCVLLP